MRLEHSIEIDCSPDQLWPWLTEPDRQMQWMHGVISNEPTSEPVNEVGSTFLMKIKEGKRVTDYNGTITTFEQPRKLGVKLVGSCGKGSPMEMQVDYALTDLGGRTRLCYDADWETIGFVMKLFTPVMYVMGKIFIKKFFKSLKTLAEKEPVAVA